MATGRHVALGALALILGAACSPAPAPPATPADRGQATGPEAATPSQPQSVVDASQQGQGLPSLDRMIVRNVGLTLAVRGVAEAYRQVEQIAAESGGFVSGSQLRREGERAVATVTVRVPADSRIYQAALERLRAVAERILKVVPRNWTGA